MLPLSLAGNRVVSVGAQGGFDCETDVSRQDESQY